MARGRTVTAAVIRRAQMRGALQNFPPNEEVGLTWIKACNLPSTPRVMRYRARLWRMGLVFRGPPVGGPFPDIADHVAHAVAIRRERGHRRGALISVLIEILERKFALPGIGHVLAAGRERIAPGIFLA